MYNGVHSTAKQREETEFRGLRHLNASSDWFSLNLARQSSAEGFPDLPGLSMNWFIGKPSTQTEPGVASNGEYRPNDETF